MTDDTTPLAPDQPEQHVYEPPHHIADYPSRCDAYWFLDGSDLDFNGPRVVAMIDRKTRTFGIEPRGCHDMDSGTAMRIASLLADAVRWATGEIEKLNTPAPSETAKQDAGRQDASGGQSS